MRYLYSMGLCFSPLSVEMLASPHTSPADHGPVVLRVAALQPWWKPELHWMRLVPGQGCAAPSPPGAAANCGSQNPSWGKQGK